MLFILLKYLFLSIHFQSILIFLCIVLDVMHERDSITLANRA